VFAGRVKALADVVIVGAVARVSTAQASAVLIMNPLRFNLHIKKMSQSFDLQIKQ
jgi:tRNA(Leu) C34 or U34 (ribose-2'-O)-methylase TrmL